MLVRVGPRQSDPDVVDLLLECHERIRKFAGMATRLAAANQPEESDVRATAAAIRRYFAEALPLHVADEEEDLVPLLSGRAPDVDAALAAMRSEHVEHGPDLERLITLCAELEGDPRRHGTVAAALGDVASRLSEQFATHLDREEQVLFPALRALSQPERDGMRAKLRERRAK